MLLKKTLLLGSALFLIGASGTAGYRLWPEKNELASSFCSKLEDEKIYDENGLSNYSRLIPGKNGWIFRTKNDFRSDWKINDKTTNYLLSLQDAFSKHNQTLVIVMLPVRGLVHADQLFRHHRDEYGLTNTDTAWDKYESSIRDLQKNGVNVVGINRDDAVPDFFYKRNHHWSAEGARIVAGKVAEVVRTMPVYDKISHQKYATEKTNSAVYKSSFEKAFKKICGTDIPDEMANHYETSSVTAADNASMIFDNSHVPQTVLLGTSNSVSESSEANFEGFLKEYLSSDILNLSYIGGGIDTSIMSYLDSDHFSASAPKIVIWEVPGYYDFNVMDDKLFNQIIPAAFGSCATDPAHEMNFGEISSGQTIIYSLQSEDSAQGTQPVSISAEDVAYASKDFYIHLEFSRPLKNKFSLQFQYENGGKKIQNFEKTKEYAHDGNFYTLFLANSNPLQEIRLVLPKEEGHVGLTAQICSLPQRGESSTTEEDSL